MRDLVKYWSVAAFASIALVSGTAGHAASIVLVTNNVGSNSALIAHLENNLGHTVTTGNFYAMDTSAAELAQLNAADLVIVSRVNDSAAIANNAAEVAAWDSVTTPILLGSGWIARSNRWMWANATTMQEHYTNDVSAPVGTLTQHPFYANVPPNEDHLNGGVGSPPISGLSKYRLANTAPAPGNGNDLPATSSILGNGTIIGVRNNALTPNVYIASWEAGQVTGSNNILADDRVFFAMPSNFTSLTPSGVAVFDNIVGAMLVPEPATYLAVIPALLGLIYLKRRK